VEDDAEPPADAPPVTLELPDSEVGDELAPDAAEGEELLGALDEPLVDDWLDCAP
jgi:hypothetical protein